MGRLGGLGRSCCGFVRDMGRRGRRARHRLRVDAVLSTAANGVALRSAATGQSVSLAAVLADFCGPRILLLPAQDLIVIYETEHTLRLARMSQGIALDVAVGEGFLLGVDDHGAVKLLEFTRDEFRLVDQGAVVTIDPATGAEIGRTESPIEIGASDGRRVDGPESVRIGPGGEYQLWTTCVVDERGDCVVDSDGAHFEYWLTRFGAHPARLDTGRVLGYEAIGATTPIAFA